MYNEYELNYSNNIYYRRWPDNNYLRNSNCSPFNPNDVPELRWWQRMALLQLGNAIETLSYVPLFKWIKKRVRWLAIAACRKSSLSFNLVCVKDFLSDMKPLMDCDSLFSCLGWIT